MTNPLDAWVAEVCAALGVDPSVVDRNTLLDLARDAAHGVARPAAPLTTFIAGLAAGTRGGSATDIADAMAVVRRLLAQQPVDIGPAAEQHADESTASGPMSRVDEGGLG